ncbi:MAG: tyrosine-type recombinase/integrase [Candidatus Nanoarchaeia archaeon]|jgi:site-specific recombinase XerD
MKDTWELHGYGKDLDSRLKKIKDGKVSDISNKNYLLDYYDCMLSQGLSIPRITKCLRLIQKADEYFKKDLKTLDEKDVIHYFGWLEQSSYSDWTKNDYKTELKKFLKWIYNDEPPKFVLKIKSGVKNQNKLLPQEVITEQEALKLIECSTSIRNKALISILYESGCRIGEILTLKIKHIVFDEYGCLMNVNGKTGVRQVRIISSTQILSQWLTDHSEPGPESYVWSSRQNSLINYNSIRKLLKETAKRAGITKRVNPHSFRHARATHMANKLTEAQMKMYFGWTQSSKMASVYVHLSGRDVDNAILDVYGIKRKDDVKDTFAPKKCRCGQLNTPNNKYCSKCGQILDLKLQIEVSEKKAEVQDFFTKMMNNPEMFEKLKAMVETQ